MPKYSSRISTILLFCSGFAGLVYQTLWMKQLGLLFGNTAYATSVTLGVFFAGLAVGSWLWGKRSATTKNPLRLYAWMEIGVAVTGMVYYGLLAIFYWIYPHLYRAEPGTVAMLLAKSGLAILLIFPPALFMGGTLPAVAEHLIRSRSSFGKTSALLYGTNTMGAALGVGCAAFILIPMLGFRATYAVAVILTITVAFVAWRLSANPAEEPHKPASTEPLAKADKVDKADGPPKGHWPVIASLSFLSGFSVLALEVLWTRMFAQVHENSVYAFAVILVVVLVCLGLGAWLSSRLARFNLPPLPTLGALTMLGGLVLVIGPALFMKATDGMIPVSSLESWPRYVFRVFKMGFLGVGPVALILGMIFPFLMKAAEQSVSSPGKMLGRLLALNTFGSIFGALACGFVFLPNIGMWGTMRLIATLYLTIGILFPYGRGNPLAFGCRALGGFFLLLLYFTPIDPTNLPTTGIDPNRPEGKILEIWEGSDCTVSVEESPSGHRYIKINSAYMLGSTAAFSDQVNQARIPLYLHPSAKRLFFLGLGTGMSAGASLDGDFPQVEKVVSCELVPQVVEAAKKYMPEQLTNSIFTDPRSTILIEDGRHHLMATEETYDIINADLFLPYRRGAGSLYSRDHFLTAKKRLAPGGMYVQWLPLFQLTENEFGIIARTMLDTFGHVSMWRNNFTPGHEIVALIGQREPTPIPDFNIQDPQALASAIDGLTWQGVQPGMALPEQETIPFFYAGNLTASKDIFQSYPINTDDKPLIEYQTPRTFRQANDKKDPFIWFLGPKIADLTEKLFERCPPASDPILKDRSTANREFALAGLAFHRTLVYKSLNKPQQSNVQWEIFLEKWRSGAGQ